MLSLKDSAGLKSRLMVAGLLLTLVITGAPLWGADKPVGDFAIQTGRDQYIWLADHSGKTLVVAFILTTCTHCQFTTGLLRNIQTDYAQKGVEVFETAIESMSSLHVAEFVKKFSVNFPVGYNELNYVGKFLGYPDDEPFFTPQLIFVDRRGIIRHHLSGDDPSLAEAVQDKTLRAMVDDTLKQGVAPGASSRAVTQTKTVK